MFIHCIFQPSSSSYEICFKVHPIRRENLHVSPLLLINCYHLNKNLWLYLCAYCVSLHLFELTEASIVVMLMSMAHNQCTSLANSYFNFNFKYGINYVLYFFFNNCLNIIFNMSLRKIFVI